LNTLKKAATEIADQEPEPTDCTDRISYLLEQLQAEAEKDYKSRNFETVLATLRDRLKPHIDKGICK